MFLKCLGAMSLAAVMAVFGAMPALAQEQEVRLSPIEMIESKNTIDHITQVDMERKTATNLWEAMRGVLGVYQQTSAGRNEGTISLRGSSRYQVGLFIDDIPIATAYRNEFDFNNTMLYDLESIEVSKGYSSPLLITNSGLGGVVNLRTAKPTKEMEFTAKYMNFFDRSMDDQGRFFGASVGTKQEQFYLKATVMQNQRDFFTLPSGFTSSRFEDGGRRENSDNENKAVNLMAGWTPTEAVDIMFGFVRQSMEKGQPPDAAQDVCRPDRTTCSAPSGDRSFPFSRFWRWPEYETTRYYMNANVNLNEKARLKTVLYYDGHKDTTWDYTDATFATRTANALSGNQSRGGQTYDQYTSGGQLAFDYAFNEINKLAVSAGYRQLSHKGFSENQVGIFSPSDHITEDYWDFGAEYTLKPFDPLALVFGASSSHLTPKATESFNNGWQPYYNEGQVGSKNLFNYQVGAFYDLTENHELFLTFAKKSRFASMRERYYRNGGVPTNPDLKPENAFHYEVGYRGLINDWLKLNSSLYYSEITDQIFQDRDAQGDTFFRNLDKSDFYGFELGGEALFNQYLSAGLTFNAMKWKTDGKYTGVSNDYPVKLTGLPKLTSTVYAVVSPLEGLSIIPQLNMSSGFYWGNSMLVRTQSGDEKPNPYEKAPGFATADLKVVYDYNDHLTFEAGAKNLFDKEYAYSAYYPEPGRNFFMGLTARF